LGEKKNPVNLTLFFWIKYEKNSNKFEKREKKKKKPFLPTHTYKGKQQMKLEQVIFFPIFWFGNFCENFQNVSKTFG
jgi:hypothetical protein